MGCPSSRPPPPPNNPLQVQQYLEAKRERRKRKQEKEQRRIAKLQKKHQRKNRNKKTKNKKKSWAGGGGGSEQRGSDAGRRSLTPRISNFNYQTMRYEFNKDEYDRVLEKKLQTQLDSDLCLFIMNQLALTVQFFVHFDSEISAIGGQILARENEINQHLEEHSVLLGNPLDACIQRRIQFKPMHGPGKHEARPLQAQTMYVVFENIDIARPNDANYDSISPICKVDMEVDFYRTTPAKEDFVELLRENKWRGYVRLKLREGERTRRPAYGEPEIYTDGSSGYSTASHSSATKSRSESAPAPASALASSHSESDYAYVTELHRHKPLAELRMDDAREQLQLSQNVLPEACVSQLGRFVEPWNVDDTDEEDEKSSEDSSDEAEGDSDDADGEEASDGGQGTSHRPYHTFRAIRQYKLELERRRQLLQQRFLNSQEFMRYFGELVRRKLAPRLGIAEAELEAGTYVGASIHTHHWQLIPAIHVAHNAQNWPDCAFQFKRRERPISTNPHTGEQAQWPTRAMINRIETFGFHVIPVGFAPKRQRNPFRQLEWRIVFPKAERYLERSLSHTQTKVFLMAKALVKAFVEPQEGDSDSESVPMSTVDFLRTHLFWECERNYTAWSEEFLGEVLLRFLGSFTVRLREKTLPDFFIQERNLFESIPDFSLLRLNQILADVLANPLMHLMVAFRSLAYAEDFFPKLNFRKFFDVLVENDILQLRRLAKNARSLGPLDAADGEQAAAELELSMDDVGSQGLLGMKEHRERTKGKLRRRTQVLRHKLEVRKQIELERKRLSVESIDVEFTFTRNLNASSPGAVNQGVENLRRTNVLELILDNLLATAAIAMRWRSVHLAKKLLDQARLLARLYHNCGCDVGAQAYLAAIGGLENDIDVLRQTDSNLGPPALPVRTSVEPVNSRSHKIRDLLQGSAEPPSAGKKPLANGNLYVAQPPSPRLRMEGASHDSPPDPRRSIKFTEHVVEVHEGDTNPIRRPEGYSPVSILRGAGSPCTRDARDERRRLVLSEKPPAVVVTSARSSSSSSFSSSQADDDEPRRTPSPEHDTEPGVEGVSAGPVRKSVVIRKSTGNAPIARNQFGSSGGILKKGSGSPTSRPRQPRGEGERRQSPQKGRGNSGEEEEASSRPEDEEAAAEVATAADARVHNAVEASGSGMKGGPDGKPAASSTTSALLDKLGSAAEALRSSSFARSKPVTQLTASTDKLISTIGLEEKCAKMSRIVRRNTILLKGAFNQSSDT